MRSPPRNEPIYEPILPPIPPPLPPKSEQDTTKYTSKTEVDASTNRIGTTGPVPLQRSPVMDNAAWKALSEQQSLNERNKDLVEDIAEQLENISCLAKHMAEKGRTYCKNNKF